VVETETEPVLSPVVGVSTSLSEVAGTALLLVLIALCMAVACGAAYVLAKNRWR
jgi:hypothetical protein